MKPFSLLFLFFLGLFCLPLSAQRLHIEGRYAGADGTVLYLKQYTDKNFVTLDSARTYRGKFFFNRPVYDVLAYGITSNKTAKQPPLFFAGADSMVVKLDEAKARIEVSHSPIDSLYRILLPWTESEDFSIDSLVHRLPASPLTPYFLLRTSAWQLSLDKLKAIQLQLDTVLQYNYYYRVFERFVAAREAVAVGETAPNFRLREENGRLVQLTDFRSHPVVLSFWASWCHDCRREIPYLVSTYERLKAQGVVFISISLDTSYEKWKSYTEQSQMKWLQLSELNGWDSSVVPLYALRWIPTTFIIDPTGKILSVSHNSKELKENLEKAFP